MGKKYLIFSFLIIGTYYTCVGQILIKASDIFPTTVDKPGAGNLKIIQDPQLDTLLSRYILNKKNQTEPNGFRILIYRSSVLKARDESGRINADFMTLFPAIPAYRVFQEPNYYLVLAGNFRSRTEGLKTLLRVKKKYPNAFFVPFLLNWDDLNKTDSELENK
jgi:hypothetical protein